MSDEMDILRVIEPQLEAAEIIATSLVDAGLCYRPHAEGMTRAIIARLAQHDPPILLCYPDQCKDGES